MKKAIDSKAWADLPVKIREALANNNLASLKPEERIALYEAMCAHKGLDPASRPFEFITLNGKLAMYARKEAADQLREIHEVSTEILSADKEGDAYVVQVRASLPGGRKEDDIGATGLTEPEYLSKKDGTKYQNPRYGKPMEGVDMANAMMKAVTKAKRRVTLAICGLGMMDESEIEAIRESEKGKAPTVDEVKAIVEKVAGLREQYAKALKADKAAIMAEIVELEDSIMDLPGSTGNPVDKAAQENPPEGTAASASAQPSPSGASAGQTTPATEKPAEKPAPVEKPAKAVKEKPAPVEKPVEKPAETPPAQEEPLPVAEPETPAEEGEDEDDQGEPEPPAAQAPAAASESPLASIPTDDWQTHVLQGIPSTAMKGKKVGELPLDTLEKIKVGWIDVFIAKIPEEPAKAKDAACILRALKEKRK